MKKQITHLLSLLTIFIFNGCAYESEFDLLGAPVKYNKLVLGSFHSEEDSLDISRIDDYKIKINYKNDENDLALENAVGKFIKNGDKVYVAIKEDGKYMVGRILDISSQAIRVNILDTDEDEVGESKTFKSAKEFTQFVVNNKSIFSEEYNQTFTRN